MEGRQARGTRFARKLAECRLTAGLSPEGLALGMVAHNFPIAHYRSLASEPTADDIAWLAAQIEALEAAEPHDCWPVAIAAPEFIDVAAQCLSDVSATRTLLLLALARDEMDKLGFGIQIPAPDSP